MKAFIISFVALCLVLTLVYCEDDDTTSADRVPARTESLLGLDASHANLYQQFDSIYNYTPNLTIDVDTSLVTLITEDVSGNQTTFDIGFPSEKLARLIITTKSVAMTGFYQKIEGHDSLFYFIDIPEIFPDRLRADESWSFYVPPLYRDNEEQIIFYLNYGFGYEITRTYMGTENIVVPAGAYTAHIVKSEYRLRGTDEVIKTDTEYLVSGIGLVRMYSSGKFGKSHILLIESEPLTEEEES
jgi:hypothetical protein